VKKLVIVALAGIVAIGVIAVAVVLFATQEPAGVSDVPGPSREAQGPSPGAVAPVAQPALALPPLPAPSSEGRGGSRSFPQEAGSPTPPSRAPPDPSSTSLPPSQQPPDRPRFR
jgi:hypothetical protein